MCELGQCVHVHYFAKEFWAANELENDAAEGRVQTL